MRFSSFHGRIQVINMPHQYIGAPFSPINSKEVCASQCIGTSVTHLFIHACDIGLQFIQPNRVKHWRIQVRSATRVASGVFIAFLSLIDTSGGIKGKHHTWRGLAALDPARSINPLVFMQ
ncbi:hypothetical protein [Candidatus Nitrotoga sp. AM1P]|uniref:hypothetical protein n=1 Tax=Candidatus Nitrotoga sp. AM1P TaxID=2559597 RepID=UPI001566C2C0|nr:hypothetical protein [Candidatus Nitrotoga sp. AM1P]